MWKRVLGSLLLGMLLGSLGCGYTLSHQVKKVFESSQGIYLPVFTNDTEELGAEIVFTNALIRELKLHQRVTFTQDQKKASLELRGVVETIAYQPTALYAPDSSANLLQSYVALPDKINLTATVRVSLVDKATNQVLWSQRVNGSRIVSPDLSRTGDKEAASSFGTFTQSLIERRYEDVARDMMRDIYDSMVEIL